MEVRLCQSKQTEIGCVPKRELRKKSDEIRGRCECQLEKGVIELTSRRNYKLS